MLVMPRKKYTFVAAVSASLLFLMHFHNGTRAALSDYYHRAHGPEVEKGTFGHLILVPCHGIWNPESSSPPIDSDSWWLSKHQNSKEGVTFVSHIRRAVELLQRDPSAVLVFSGGQTNAQAGPLGEGQSYLMLAEKLYQESSSIHDSLSVRATSEDFARDSYENLLFSIARFQEFTGKLPQQVTIVGYEFKKARFLNLHTTAIHYPVNHVRYIGIDGPNIKPHEVAQGEHIHAYAPFTEDPYGCWNEEIKKKRVARNPFHRQPPYTMSCPDLAPIFNVCLEPNLFPTTYKVPGFPDPHDHGLFSKTITEEFLEPGDVQGEEVQGEQVVQGVHGVQGGVGAHGVQGGVGAHGVQGGVGAHGGVQGVHGGVQGGVGAHGGAHGRVPEVQGARRLGTPEKGKGLVRQKLQLEKKLEDHEFPRPVDGLRIRRWIAKKSLVDFS